MSYVCGNCEKQDATLICEQCEGEDSYFCQQCWDIHIQVKLFRRHSSHAIRTSPHDCVSHNNANGGPVKTCNDVSPSCDERSQLNLQRMKLEKGKSNKVLSDSLEENEPLINCNSKAAPVLKPQRGYMEGLNDAIKNIADKRPDYEKEFHDMFSKPHENECTEDLNPINDLNDHSEPISFLEHVDNILDACSNVSDNGELNRNVILYGFIAAASIHIITKFIFGKYFGSLHCHEFCSMDLIKVIV